MAWSRGSFNIVERDVAIDAARRGGKSRSSAKVRAAKRNGKLGGRPCTLTVAHHLFGRELTSEDRKRLPDVLHQLLVREKEMLKGYFGVSPDDVTALNSTPCPKKERKPAKEVRYLLAKLRLAAEHLMPQRATKPPKDYVVVRGPKTEGERNAWERLHPDMPFVTTRPKRIRFEQMASYRHLDMLLTHNPNLSFSVSDVKEEEGSRLAITDEVAEAVLEYLKFKHKSP
jgi:hypothetical protein